MSKAARLDQFFKHDLWAIDLDSVHGLRRVGLQTIRLILAAIGEFQDRLLDARAAGLVYTTLLSLVPFLALTFSVLKAFGVHQMVEPVLAQALEPLGEKGADITRQVIGFVNNIKVGVLGLVGIGGLIYTTYALIDKIEGTFNAIWRVPRGRSWGRKFADYLSVVLVGPVLVTAAFALLASVQSNTLVQKVLAIQPFGYLAVWAAQLMPYLLLSALFSFLYKFIPNTTVRVSSALVGGVTAAVLWGIAGEVFAAFVVQSSKYSAIYSGFAILVLFFLWLYINWVIILVGGQVAFFHQHPATYRTRFLQTHATHGFRERFALLLLVEIARRHLAGGGPLPTTEIAADMHMPLSIVEEQVKGLIELGFLCRIIEPEGIGIARPPELIAVSEVLDAIRDRDNHARTRASELGSSVDRLLERRNRIVREAFRDVSLRSLVKETFPESSVRRSDEDAHEPPFASVS